MITQQVQPSVRIATLANLASLYAAEGRTEAAYGANQEALSLAKRIYGPEHLYSGWLWLARAAILRKAHQKPEAKEAQHRGQEILALSGIERLGNSVPYTALTRKATSTRPSRDLMSSFLWNCRVNQ
jgi:hypothetical protein